MGICLSLCVLVYLHVAIIYVKLPERNILSWGMNISQSIMYHGMQNLKVCLGNIKSLYVHSYGRLKQYMAEVLKFTLNTSEEIKILFS